jgi:hypothetical protein
MFRLDQLKKKFFKVKNKIYQLPAYKTVKPVLRGHLWDKEKSGLIREVTS